MKNRVRILIIVMSILFVTSAFAANPLLDAKDDRPISADFRGTEWNDENIDGEIPLTARVVTTRIATMPWGAIFRIEFCGSKIARQTKARDFATILYRNRESHFSVERREQRRGSEENFGDGQAAQL